MMELWNFFSIEGQLSAIYVVGLAIIFLIAKFDNAIIEKIIRKIYK